MAHRERGYLGSAADAMGLVAGKAMKPIWWLALCLGMLVLLRLPLAFQYDAFGNDMGSYLMTRNWVLGIDVAGPGTAHFRPPLIGFLLLPFTLLLGDLMGSKVLWLVMSVAPALGMFYLASQFLPRWWAFGVGFSIAVLPTLGWITALNQITLLAMALVFWGLAEMVKLSRGEGWIWRLVLPVFLLVGLNQTTTAVFVVLALITLSLGANWKRIAQGLGLAVLVSLPWLYFYQEAVPFLSGLGVSGTPVLVLSPRWGWVALFAFLLWRLKGENKLVAAWGMSMALFSSFLSGEGTLAAFFSRTAFFVPVFGVLCLGVFLSQLAREGFGWIWGEKKIWAIVFSLLLVLSQVLWFQTFSRGATWYNMITMDTLPALEWIRASTPDTAKFMVHPDGLGNYVGGYANRRWEGTTGRGTPIRQRQGVDAAFTCSMGWRQGCDPYELLDRFGIGYILVDKAHWQTVNDNGIGWDTLGQQPWLDKQAQFGDSVVVYKVMR